MASLTADLPGGRRKLPKQKLVIAGAVFLAALLIGGAFYYAYRTETSEEFASDLPRVLPSNWLIKYFGHDDEYDLSIAGPNGDPDQDLLTNFQEFYFNTDPSNPDTDGDGQADGAEIVVNSDPLGNGRLFSDEYVRQFGENFIEENNIELFKEENVRQSILALLQPPDPELVDLQLPPVNTLNVIGDNSEGAAQRFVLGANTESEKLFQDVGGVQDAVLNSDTTQVSHSENRIYQSIDKLREVPVPLELVTYHQLQIASLFASARALQMVPELDPFISLEEQPETTRALYTELARIEKINLELGTELAKLSVRYPDLFKQ